MKQGIQASISRDPAPEKLQHSIIWLYPEAKIWDILLFLFKLKDKLTEIMGLIR